MSVVVGIPTDTIGSEFDVIPAETAVIVAVPGVPIRLEDTVAVNCVAFTNVVGKVEPFQLTTVAELNPVPVTISAKVDPPAATVLGLSELIVGPAPMVNVAGAEITPPLATVTLSEPGLAIRLAPTVVVNWVALTNVVGNAEPFQLTIAPTAKPVPFTVIAKAGPVAVVAFGASMLIVGPAAMVNVAGAEVTPPLVTVTLTELGVAIRLAPTAVVN